jgi:hypothetical protein
LDATKSIAGAAQVIEPPEHVVVPPRRKGKARPRGAALVISLNHFAGRSSAEEAAFEEILLAPYTSRGHLRVVSDAEFVLEQSLEHADRGVERRPRGTVGRLAVPAAIGQLLGEQPVDDAPDVLAEIRADRAYLPIDTGLHLTGKEEIAITLLRAATLPMTDLFGFGTCRLGGLVPIF